MTFEPPPQPTDDKQVWFDQLRAALGEPRAALPDSLRDVYGDRARFFSTRGDTCFLVTKDGEFGKAIQTAGCGLIRDYTKVRGGETWWDINLPAYLTPICR